MSDPLLELRRFGWSVISSCEWNRYRRMNAMTNFVNRVRVFVCCCRSAPGTRGPGTHPHLNPDLKVQQRAADLVSRMTLDEKVLQMQKLHPQLNASGFRRTTGGTKPCMASPGLGSSRGCSCHGQAGDRRAQWRRRLDLRGGEQRDVSFTLTADDVPKSKVHLSVGGGQPSGKTPRVEGEL